MHELTNEQVCDYAYKVLEICGKECADDNNTDSPTSSSWRTYKDYSLSIDDKCGLTITYRNSIVFESRRCDLAGGGYWEVILDNLYRSALDIEAGRSKDTLLRQLQDCRWFRECKFIYSCTRLINNWRYNRIGLHTGAYKDHIVKITATRWANSNGPYPIGIVGPGKLEVNLKIYFKERKWLLFHRWLKVYDARDAHYDIYNTTIKDGGWLMEIGGEESNQWRRHIEDIVYRLKR